MAEHSANPVITKSPQTITRGNYQNLLLLDMSFLVSFFCLFLTCTATPPVIVHTPAPIVEPKEFTIESVGIAEPAKSMQKKQNLGTIALGATIEQLLAQEESLFAEIDKDGTVLRVIVI